MPPCPFFLLKHAQSRPTGAGVAGRTESGRGEGEVDRQWSGSGPVSVGPTGPEADQTTKTGPLPDQSSAVASRPANPDNYPALRWLFLDMNSFFASCEQYDDPALRGKPVGVCPVLAAGGAVIAASYEAKAFGVSMTRAAEARRRCPGIALLQARPDRYVELHHAVKRSIEKHLPITTTYSIDEWAVRLMGEERTPTAARRLAARIQRQIDDDFDGALPCSVGLAPSRLLAKTACELHKPHGLTVLTMDRMPGILEPMELRDIPGVGSGMDLRLRQNDVTTPAELWALSRADCRRVWGSVQGEYFWSGFHGVDPVEPATHRRSMGHAHILPPQYRTESGAYGILTRLLCKAIMRCRRDGYFAHRLRVHVSFAPAPGNFAGSPPGNPAAPGHGEKHSGGGGGRWVQEIELPAVNDTPTVLEHFERLWARRPWTALPGAAAPTPHKVSVDLGGLTPARSTAGHLFRQTDQPRRLSAVLDQVNRKFGAHKLHPGSMTHIVDYQMDDKIAFGRIPEQDIPM